MGMSVDQGGGKKGRSRPEMNVTPLVDVVLVLLIIFMVLTPLLAKQFWIHLPEQRDEEQQPPPASDDGPLVVSVTSNGTIRINSDEVADAQFPDKLRRVLAARRTRTVFFDANDEADFGRAVEVLDMTRGGGATTIAVATEAMPGID